MIFRNRRMVRLAAVALLASGAFTGLGAPAQAAGTETDLSLDVVGTRVADGAGWKLAFAKVTNNGRNTPSELTVRIDVSKVDKTKVFVSPNIDGCLLVRDETAYECTATTTEGFPGVGGLPGPGETLDMPMLLLKPTDGLDEAYRFPLTFTLISKDDTTADNNVKSADVELTKESGADLAVLADDVKNAVTVTGDRIETAGDLHAGDTARLIYDVWNQGDVATAGLKISVRLPKGVTFSEKEDDCEYNSSNSSLVCTYANLPFAPRTSGKGGEGSTFGGSFYHLLSVGEDVKAGSLTGGTVSVEPILAGEGFTARSTNITTRPENMTPLQDRDLDPSDNTDGYAVIVSAKGGAGGGNGNGNGNGEGGLPVTGPQAGLIGGIGVAVLAVGGAMFLVARRRRVVLVAPSDEKPTD